MSVRTAWKFEDALPCLRRFASAVVCGGLDPVVSDRLARTAIKSVLAQKFPLSNAEQLRIVLYQTMLIQCSELDSVAQDTASMAFLPPSTVARGLYRLAEDERTALVLTVVEGFSHTCAAEVLNLPLWVFLARLTRARENLQADLSRQRSSSMAVKVHGSYLRVVK